MLTLSQYLFLLGGWLLLNAGPISAPGAVPKAEEQFQDSTELSLQRVGRTLLITAEIPEGVTEVELRLRSDRNDRISRYTDVSPRDPEPRDYPYTWEAWYPVVDVLLHPGLEAVTRFRTAEPGYYSLNGKYYKHKKQVQPEVVLPAHVLEHWANELYVEPKANVPEEFYLRQRLPVRSGPFRHTVALLTEDWAGSVSLHAVAPEGLPKLGTASVDTPLAASDDNLEQLRSRGLDKPRLLASLTALVEYTLRSRNQHVSSPTADGLYLFYDLPARTYRRPDWIWPWGVATSMLLEASTVPELSERYAPEALQEIAYEIGQASLSFVERDPKQPTYGLTTSRFGETRSGFGNTYGYTEYVNPADALFLAGWGWMPLFRATGDSAFLRATQQMVESTGKLVHNFDLVPMDYVVEEGQWKDFTLNEHGFGMEGIAELYASAPDPPVREIGQAYIEQVLEKLGRPDGLWERRYNRSTGEVQGRDHLDVAKGQGWAMEGLLAAHRLMPEGRYLELARQMADHLIEHQHPTGYWPFRFTHSVEEEGVAEKGTALWSLLLYRLHQATGDERHLAAARRALQWCLDHQYTGPDPHAYGGIVGEGRRSGINFRFWFPMTCSYTSSFFGLAIVQELRLQAEDRPGMPH